jgi:uncharacterized protein
LHIFEARYQLMIGRCLEQHSPFGVLLIRQGTDIDPDAIPYSVGTTAQIQDNIRLDDGRYYLSAVGQRRFRIQYIAQRRPYLIGSVAYLPEETGAAAIKLTRELRTLYTRYWAVLAAATGHWQPPEALPEGVVELTYWMAQRLHVDILQKQRWLEADVATRLREMTAAIRAETALLPMSDAGSEERERGSSGPDSWN